MSDGITFVGLDAHKQFINVCALPPGGEERVEWRTPHDGRSVRRLVRKLGKMTDGEIRCCYEAGPCGYALKRELEAGGPLVCEVIAPSLIPVKPGDRVKTDRRDARKLAELLRAGLLTEVQAPSPEAEAARDLCRARDQIRKDLMRCRHRLSKFLLRRGIRYEAGKSAWTKMHRMWLRRLEFELDTDRLVFNDYLLDVEQHEERQQTMDEAIERLSKKEPYARPVAWLRCYRGIDTLTAMALVTELFDIRRFGSARELMSYVGMTPREYSSGVAKRGSITKAGNGFLRRLFVETTQHYRHSPRTSASLARRRRGQPAAVIAHAERAQHRLYRRYKHLTDRGKEGNKAIVACARELVGFVWATLQMEAQSAKA